MGKIHQNVLVTREPVSMISENIGGSKVSIGKDSVLRKFKHHIFPKSRILSMFPISKKSEKRTKERFQKRPLDGMPNSKFYYISIVHKHNQFLLINFPRHVQKQNVSFLAIFDCATLIVDYQNKICY